MFTSRKKFPFVHQADSKDCGPACMFMIAKHFGRKTNLPLLRNICGISREGSTLAGLENAASFLHLRSISVMLPLSKVPGVLNIDKAPLPALLLWKKSHFVVLYRMTKRFAYLCDPSYGRIRIPRDVFEQSWEYREGKGIAVLFDSLISPPDSTSHSLELSGIHFLFHHVAGEKKGIAVLFFGLLMLSMIQLIIPFLTRSIVDDGIQSENLNIVQIILVGQVILLMSMIYFKALYQWVVLQISTRLNIHMVTQFLFHLTRKPMMFFDSLSIGDLFQRIGDHERIEHFITQSFLTLILSGWSFLVLGLVLMLFSLKIFFLFIVFTMIYLLWITLFLRYRRRLDYAMFDQMAEQQNSVYELVQGCRDIKLFNSAHKRINHWRQLQFELYRLKKKFLGLSLIQESGGNMLNHGKDLLITYYVASSVIQGDLSLGSMFAIQHISGQLNAPLATFAGFVRNAQDAWISVKRMQEIHIVPEKDSPIVSPSALDTSKDLILKDVQFCYPGQSIPVLRNVNFKFESGSRIAIVGKSGSGKTTLIKLMSGILKPTKGTVLIGDLPMDHLEEKAIWSSCGVIQQDNFIFSDSIANNIAESSPYPDFNAVIGAAKMTLLDEWITELPEGYGTKIGPMGRQLSGGQVQRILLARALYRSPKLLFLDEATNALDDSTEFQILKNIDDFLPEITLVYVAHRLSTIKHADQILVVANGEIVSSGSHQELMNKKDKYFELIKNQIEN